MEVKSCDELFKDFAFSLPLVSAITQPKAQPVDVYFLKMLLLKTGGRLVNAKMLGSESSFDSDKTLLKIAAKSVLSRTEIDCKLTEHTSKSKSPF